MKSFYYIFVITFSHHSTRILNAKISASIRHGYVNDFTELLEVSIEINLIDHGPNRNRGSHFEEAKSDLAVYSSVGIFADNPI